MSYSIFSYLETSVHDKESFAKEQSKFSGSKSLNIDPIKINKNSNKKENTNDTKVNTELFKFSGETTGVNKRMTVAELFLKESEKDFKEKEKGTEVVETIEKFDKMDLYKSIFLSDSEEDVGNKEENTDCNDFVDKPKNIERNLSPPRGIFANIDFDELNSWKRRSEDKKTDQLPKSNENEKDIKNCKVEENHKNNEPLDQDVVYGPKIPEVLQKRLESEISTDFRPTFRRKDEMDMDDSSSSSDSWVEAKEVKAKKQKKKKSKKHKSKHKKSKHKKKDR